jgi:hypothetical protein
MLQLHPSQTHVTAGKHQAVGEVLPSALSAVSAHDGIGHCVVSFIPNVSCSRSLVRFAFVAVL